MSHFKAKMHQIRFRLREFAALPDPKLNLRGPTSKGREEGKVMGKEKG